MLEIIHKNTRIGDLRDEHFQCEVLQILFCIADTVDISYLIQFKISEFQSEIYETT